MKTTTEKPAVQAKLDCLCRAKNSLRETVIDLEKHIGSAEALRVAAGAMRSLSQVERLHQRLAREAAE
jgi:hypothetical protein